MMTRERKTEQVASLSEQFGRAKAAFLVDFKGLKVEQMTALRKQLGASDSKLQVVRNTLASLALKNHASFEKVLNEKLIGTNAVVFSFQDASASAKALKDFAKDNEEFVLKFGVMDGQALDAKGIDALSKLPSKEVLRAQFLGLLQAPMGKFLRTLNEVPAGFVRTLNAKKEKQAN